ncbi:MAG: FAD/NAD(P)-binding protein [Acidobacteriota bacterium]
MAPTLDEQMHISGSAEAMLPRAYAIRRVKRETADTFTMEFEPVDGASELTFAAGQFNMLYVFGVGEVPISISGNPANPQTLVHTTRVVGTVTKALGELKRGDRVGIRGAYGRGWPVAAATGNDVVIVAGGIGLAPLRPVMYEMLAAREKFGKVVLLYGTRTPADILFRKELEEWRARFDLEVFITVDRGSPDWRGNVGVVTTLIPKAPFDPTNTLAMICGPEVMMRFTINALQKRGVPAEAIYVSMERNMKCAIGFCGHCQYGGAFICKDGPVFSYAQIQELFGKSEI